jgi:hypothetical protein
MPSYSIEASAVHPFRPQRDRPPPHGIREEFRRIARQAPEDDGGPGVRTSWKLKKSEPTSIASRGCPLQAWADHGRGEARPHLSEIKALAAELTRGARVTDHLLWGCYSIAWKKPR